MAHGRRKPRQPRALRNPIEHALLGATKLMEFEISDTLAPTLECAARLQAGTATEDHHTVVHTILLIAQDIEKTGVVRGLREHIEAGLTALQAQRARAMATGTWQPPTPEPAETAAIEEALHLHRFQLQHISSGELQAVVRKLIARTTSTGGQAVRCAAQSLGLAQ